MRKRADGFTIVELMVAVCIVAIVIALAQPSFIDAVERRRIEGAGTELSTDLQYTRSLSASRNTSVALTTASDGKSYTIADSSGGTTHRTVTLPDSLSMTASTTITYESVRGTANAADITISSNLRSDTIRVSTNVMGRVQMCIPSGNLGGYAAC